VEAAARSDCGRHRSVNEDNCLSDTALGIYAVADGMGGHGSGDVASESIIATLKQRFKQANRNLSLDEYIDYVHSVIADANRLVFEENQRLGRESGNGMGSTLVGLYLPTPTTPNGFIFNVGDSRLYRYRDTTLTQLTEDHTLLREWQLNNDGGPPPPGNIIMRGMGLFQTVEADITPVELSSGDILLICSDGLSDMLSDAEISGVLDNTQPQSSDAICDELVRRANRNGGIDNITAIILRVP